MDGIAEDDPYVMGQGYVSRRAYFDGGPLTVYVDLDRNGKFGLRTKDRDLPSQEFKMGLCPVDACEAACKRVLGIN